MTTTTWNLVWEKWNRVEVRWKLRIQNSKRTRDCFFFCFESQSPPASCLEIFSFFSQVADDDDCVHEFTTKKFSYVRTKSIWWDFFSIFQFQVSVIFISNLSKNRNRFVLKLNIFSPLVKHEKLRLRLVDKEKFKLLFSFSSSPPTPLSRFLRPSLTVSNLTSLQASHMINCKLYFFSLYISRVEFDAASPEKKRQEKKTFLVFVFRCLNSQHLNTSTRDHHIHTCKRAAILNSSRAQSDRRYLVNFFCCCGYMRNKQQQRHEN